MSLQKHRNANTTAKTVLAAQLKTAAGVTHARCPCAHTDTSGHDKQGARRHRHRVLPPLLLPRRHCVRRGCRAKAWPRRRRARACWAHAVPALRLRGVPGSLPCVVACVPAVRRVPRHCVRQPRELRGLGAKGPHCLASCQARPARPTASGHMCLYGTNLALRHVAMRFTRTHSLHSIPSSPVLHNTTQEPPNTARGQNRSAAAHWAARRRPAWRRRPCSRFRQRQARPERRRTALHHTRRAQAQARAHRPAPHCPAPRRARPPQHPRIRPGGLHGWAPPGGPRRGAAQAGSPAARPSRAAASRALPPRAPAAAGRPRRQSAAGAPDGARGRQGAGTRRAGPTGRSAAGRARPQGLRHCSAAASHLDARRAAPRPRPGAAAASSMSNPCHAVCIDP